MGSLDFTTKMPKNGRNGVIADLLPNKTDMTLTREFERLNLSTFTSILFRRNTLKVLISLNSEKESPATLRFLTPFDVISWLYLLCLLLLFIGLCGLWRGASRSNTRRMTTAGETSFLLVLACVSQILSGEYRGQT